MDLPYLFQQLGIALGLGLLVGLQRESVASPLAGFRTFPLVTVMGTVSSLLSLHYGGWIIAAGFIALAGVIVIGNIASFKNGRVDPGLTTEVAMLLMFAVGSYLVVGYREIAIAVGGGVAVLLQFKGQLHGLAKRLGADDVKAIMQFALISLVILPVLPNQTYGLYSVINPRQIWWMVVLIVGIGLAGYIAYKFFGAKLGVAVAGLLGGLISSTATTVSAARMTRDASEKSRLATIIIMIATAVVFLRVLFEVAVVAPGFLGDAVPPILTLFVLCAILGSAFWLRDQKEDTQMSEQGNPSELKPALLFALLYVVVLVGVAAAKENFGTRGLYVVAALAGLTDVDAITLSTSHLVNSGRLEPASGVRLIVIAVTSNLFFKGAAIVFLGHRDLLKTLIPLYGVVLLASAAVAIFWPS
jgi:uncharacterized membrane protein (DUF4010 family)